MLLDGKEPFCVGQHHSKPERHCLGMEQCSYPESRSADIPKLGGTVAGSAVSSSVAVVGAGDGTVLVSHDWGAGDLGPAKEARRTVSAAKRVSVADGGCGGWTERCESVG